MVFKRLKSALRLPDGSSCQVMSRCNGEPEFCPFKNWWKFQPSKDIPSIKSVNMDPNNSGTSTRNWKIEILGAVGPPDGLDQTKTGPIFSEAYECLNP